MKILVRLAAALYLLIGLPACAVSPPPPVTGHGSLHASLTRLPLAFEPNVGQAPADVRFVAQGERYRMWLTAGEARFAATRVEPARELRLRIVGGAAAPAVTGSGELPGKTHYYIGRSAADWRTDVPTYRRVVYRDVYPHTDLVFHGEEREPEFDFVVGPGGDPGAIELALEGAERITLDGGDVVARAGDLELRLHRPVVYQEVGGRRIPVEGRFGLDGHRIAFYIGDYDRTRTLVIDPVVTFLGGAAAGGGGSLARDGAGNLYVVRGERVVKLSPDGATQLYSVTLGTSVPTALTVDGAGNAYVGASWAFGRFEDSAFFPITPNALTPDPGHPMSQGDFTAAVAKLGATGTLLYGSFIGGNGFEVTGIAADPAGNFYYTGRGPYVGSFTQTRPAFTGVGGLNGMPAFIQAVAANFSRYLYSALIYDGDSGFVPHGIAVDRTGRAHLVGQAGRTFPTTAGAFQRSPGPGFGAGVVVKIAPDGSRFEAATFFGNQQTVPAAVAVDAGANVFFAGNARAGMPTLNALQGANAGGTDAFVARLDPTLSLLKFSTFLGGSADDGVAGIALDSSANVYVVGPTDSTNFPQVRPVPTSAGQPGSNFVAELTSDGRSLVYSTYLGTTAQFLGRIAVTASGVAYVGGSFIARLEPSEVRAFFTNPAAGATVSGVRSADVWAENYVGTSNTYTLSIGSTVLASGTAGNHATLSWDSRRVADGPQTLTATVRDSRGNVGTATRGVIIRNGTATTLGAAVTAPVEGATVAGNVAVGMAATNARGTPITFTLSVDGIQKFTASGTAATATFTWNTATVANGVRRLGLTVRDGAGQTATATRTVTVSNSTSTPGLGVAITAPKADATVRGTVWLTVWVNGSAGGSKTYTLTEGGIQRAPSVTTTSSGPVSIAWATTAANNGFRTLSVTVREGTRAGTGTVRVNVAN